MSRSTSALALGIALVSAAALPVDAQNPFRAVRMGEPIAGSLTTQDPKLGDRGAFHAYQLEAQEGTRYIITMRSGEVDAVVWVARMVGGLTDKLMEDDDAGGGTDARLRFRAPAAGTYIIVAQSLAADATGAYELNVEEAPPPAPVVATAITAGQGKEGVIDERSPLLEDQNPAVPYQLYTFTGRGERMRVTVRSGAFDAMVRVTKMNGAAEEEVASDDDSGGGTDAMVTFTSNGSYRIYARPLEANSTGAFTVTLSALPVVKITSRPMTIGQTASGMIENTDPELDSGPFFHQYAVNAEPGERLRITLRSPTFDAMVTWGRLVGTGLEDVTTDDDSAGGTDAQLDVTVPRNGTFVIRVHPLGRGETGAYTLLVERQR